MLYLACMNREKDNTTRKRTYYLYVDKDTRKDTYASIKARFEEMLSQKLGKDQFRLLLIDDGDDALKKE